MLWISSAYCGREINTQYDIFSSSEHLVTGRDIDQPGQFCFVCEVSKSWYDMVHQRK